MNDNYRVYSKYPMTDPKTPSMEPTRRRISMEPWSKPKKG